jgi:hypothetical protein
MRRAERARAAENDEPCHLGFRAAEAALSPVASDAVADQQLAAVNADLEAVAVGNDNRAFLADRRPGLRPFACPFGAAGG